MGQNWKKRRQTTLRYDITSRLECVHVSTVSQQNNTPESYGLLLYLLVILSCMTAYTTVFPQRFNLLCLA